MAVTLNSVADSVPDEYPAQANLSGAPLKGSGRIEKLGHSATRKGLFLHATGIVPLSLRPAEPLPTLGVL